MAVRSGRETDGRWPDDVSDNSVLRLRPILFTKDARMFRCKSAGMIGVKGGHLTRKEGGEGGE